MKAAAVPSVHPLGHASPSSLFFFILFFLPPGSGSRRVGGEAGRKEPDGPQSPPGSGRGPPCPSIELITTREPCAELARRGLPGVSQCLKRVD